MSGLIEKIYSKALFEITQEENSSDDVLKELSSLSVIFSQNPELIKLLSAPTLNLAEKQKVISDVFKGKISDITFNFINVIVEKNRISYIEKIIESYKELYNDYNGILKITAITSMKMSDTLKEKLIKKLESVSSKKITLIEKIDKDILGGIVLNYGNTQIDGSLKSKLDNLRYQIDETIA